MFSVRAGVRHIATLALLWLASCSAETAPLAFSAKALLATEQAHFMPTNNGNSSLPDTQVAVSGDRAVVGFVGSAFGGAGELRARGLAEVYIRSDTTWGAGDSLSPLNISLRAGDQFGYAVAISGDLIVVGAPTRGSGPNGDIVETGAAFLLASVRGWGDEQIRASDFVAGDNFGSSVSISGNTIVVGAPGVDSQAGGTEPFEFGAAYVFAWDGSTVTEQAKLMATDGQQYDELGRSVSISGDTIAVGTRGGAHVFVRSGTTWTHQAKLVPSDGLFANVKTSVSISGDTVLIGQNLDAVISAPGAAYVFVRSGVTWNEQARLTPADSAPEDGFASALSLSGDLAVLRSRPPGAGGEAHVFVRTGESWAEEATIAGDSGFARSLGISGNTIVAGDSADSKQTHLNAFAYVVGKEPGSACTASSECATGSCLGGICGGGGALDGGSTQGSCDSASGGTCGGASPGGCTVVAAGSGAAELLPLALLLGVLRWQVRRRSSWRRS